MVQNRNGQLTAVGENDGGPLGLGEGGAVGEFDGPAVGPFVGETGGRGRVLPSVPTKTPVMLGRDELVCSKLELSDDVAVGALVRLMVRLATGRRDGTLVGLLVGLPFSRASGSSTLGHTHSV